MRLLSSVGIVACLFIATGLSGIAHAQTLTTQLRWEPGASSGWMNTVLIEEGDLLTKANSETGLGIGIQLGKLILRTSLALERVNVTNIDDYNSDTRTVTFITPSFSGQYYFQPPKSEVLVTFISGRLGKTLTTINKFYEPEENHERREELFSPWIISFGGGGEYFLHKNLSLGMETGLRYAYSESNLGISPQGNWSTVSLFDFLYGVVTLNFFFL